ncbi:MAG: tetratricopeptide repeat protein [Syntrophorhabdaceae bacterium]
MKTINWKTLARVAVCPVMIAGLMTGCSSANSIFSYLKFWEPKNETPADDETQTRARAFMSNVKSPRGNPDSHYRLGVHYQARGRYRQAVEEFSKAIAIDPAHVFAYNGLGVTYDNLKEPEKAREAYREALKISPKDHHAYNNLGYSYILEGDYESAIDTLLQGISINGGDKQMRNNLAMAYIGSGESHLATIQLEEINKPGAVKTAFERVETQVQELESDRERVRLTDKSRNISTDDIAPVPPTNRFVERMTRTIKNAKKAKIRTTSKTVDLKMPRLEPGYLKANHGPRENPDNYPNDPSTQCVKHIMKTRIMDETEMLNTLTARPLWF